MMKVHTGLDGIWLESQHSGKLRQNGRVSQGSLRPFLKKQKMGQDGDEWIDNL